MKITKNSIFTATLNKDDERTGYKKGTVFHPKGVYWNHGEVIIVGKNTVGDRKGHSVRLAFPADSVDVDVTWYGA